MYFYYIYCHTRGHLKPARNLWVRVKKCTRRSDCGRVSPNPAGLPAGGFSPNPHPHPRVPSLPMGFFPPTEGRGRSWIARMRGLG